MNFVTVLNIINISWIFAGIVGALTLIAASGTAETVAEFSVPLVGVAIASMLSFGTTFAQLRWRENNLFKQSLHQQMVFKL